MGYAKRSALPRTLTREESKRLLRVTDSRSDFRDHLLFAAALGTGLRVHELCALNVAEVLNTRDNARARITLSTFKGSARHGRGAHQVVAVPTSLRVKLSRFATWKKRAGQSLAPDAPWFCGRQGRLTKRRVQQLFRRWAAVAELPGGLSFHALRHTFCQRLYEQTNDIRLVQRAARHARLETTTVYAGPSEDDVLLAVRGLEC